MLNSRQRQDGVAANKHIDNYYETKQSTSAFVRPHPKLKKLEDWREIEVRSTTWPGLVVVTLEMNIIYKMDGSALVFVWFVLMSSGAYICRASGETGM